MLDPISIGIPTVVARSAEQLGHVVPPPPPTRSDRDQPRSGPTGDRDGDLLTRLDAAHQLRSILAKLTQTDNRAHAARIAQVLHTQGAQLDQEVRTMLSIKRPDNPSSLEMSLRVVTARLGRSVINPLMSSPM